MSRLEYVIVAGGHINHFLLLKYIKENEIKKIIAADKGLEALLKINIKPNIILGDFDSIDDFLYLQSLDSKDIDIEKFSTEKDYTDTELALRRAIDDGADIITIFGATGGRLDHLLANIRILYYAYKKEIFAQIIDEHNRIYIVNNRHTLYKNKQYGKYVSILPYNKKVRGITLKGFKYELENAIMHYESSLGVSNEIVSDVASIDCKEGILIIIESKD